MTIQCILVHGLGGSPYEMERISEVLSKTGFSTHMLTLPGHNSSEQDFLRVSYEDWREHVFQKYDEAAAKGPVILVGFSLGGILALDTAENRNPAGVALLATPLYLYSWVPFFMLDWRLPFASILHKFIPVLRHPPRNFESKQIAPWHGYEEITVTKHITDMMTAQKRIRNEISRIKSPMFICQARKDMTCRAWNALWLAGHAGSKNITLRMLDIQDTTAGHHLLPTHRETKETVASEVTRFALNISSTLQ